MKPILLQILILITTVASPAFAQHCEPSQHEVFHGNDIRASISNSGNLFQSPYGPGFQVPYTGLTTPHVIFAGGLWLGGIDPIGNLQMCGQTFDLDNRFDYGPGPLNENGSAIVDSCQNWDRIWSVNQNEVLLHQDDYADNGIIDNPMRAIFSWPGQGNSSFKVYNGFDMMTTSHFGAPFADLNKNEQYEPHLGEYPHPANVNTDVIPMRISWTVFNDNSSPHSVTGGTPLKAEVQLTIFAFSCNEGSLLNESLFTSYRITNRSLSPIDSLFMGQWLDADVGCSQDDYIGCYLQGNTFFAYNQDPIDGVNGGDCSGSGGPIATYGEYPPVVSVTFLNKPMASFTYHNNGSVGSFPQAMTDPYFGAPQEFYRYLTGTWRDGTPMSIGGSGYNIPPTQITKFAFPGDPNDADAWSMYSAQLPYGDRRIIGSTRLPELMPGESALVDLAFAYHNDTALSNIENVSFMYDRVAELQGMYNSSFAEECIPNSNPCTDDCVYAGDSDHDGKVTLKDYINVAIGQTSIGTERAGPIAFIPLSSDEWIQTTEDSTNFKHIDCNGDGVITYSEFEIVETNYGSQTSWYTHGDTQQLGDDISIVPESMQVDISDHFFRVGVHFENSTLDSIYGLVFAFEYDAAAFNSVVPAQNNPLFDDGLQLTEAVHDDGRYEFVNVAYDLKNRAVEPQQMLEFIFFGNDDLILTEGIDTTYFRIADIKAILADGTILDIRGQEVALYLVDGTSAVQDIIEVEYRIYPNPSSGLLTIQSTRNQSNDLPISLFNAQGIEVYKSHSIANQLQLDLPNGVYYVVIGGRFIEKMVLAR